MVSEKIKLVKAKIKDTVQPMNIEEKKELIGCVVNLFLTEEELITTIHDGFYESKGIVYELIL